MTHYYVLLSVMSGKVIDHISAIITFFKNVQHSCPTGAILTVRQNLLLVMMYFFSRNVQMLLVGILLMNNAAK